MVDVRRALHRELMASARTEFPEMLATEVPNWSEIERMSVRRAPLTASAPKSDSARLYAQLWDEIRTRGGEHARAAPALRTPAGAGEPTQARPEAP